MKPSFFKDRHKQKRQQSTYASMDEMLRASDNMKLICRHLAWLDELICQHNRLDLATEAIYFSYIFSTLYYNIYGSRKTYTTHLQETGCLPDCPEGYIDIRDQPQDEDKLIENLSYLKGWKNHV
jgi:hypothetical protein